MAGFRGRLALLQSLTAPTLLPALPPGVPRVLLVRDVRYWDRWTNHETGWRRLAKGLYQRALAPAVARFREQTGAAVARADLVVANSAFLAGRLQVRFGREALVVYPRTPLAPEPLPPGSVAGMVGDGADKGGLILRALARAFPDVTFRLHLRRPGRVPLPPNVVPAPWESDPARLYHDVRLMLVPSQVDEAYGRVAAEALGHGVPVLASRRGGLPEAVPDLAWTVAEPERRSACSTTGWRPPSIWNSRPDEIEGRV